MQVRIHPLAKRRVLAYAADCLGYLGLAATTVPLGLALNRRHLPTEREVLALSAIPPVLATVWATWGNHDRRIRRPSGSAGSGSRSSTGTPVHPPPSR